VGGGTHIPWGCGQPGGHQGIQGDSRRPGHRFRRRFFGPGNAAESKMLADAGVKLLGLAALDDDAKPATTPATPPPSCRPGMSVAAVSPERLAQWVGDQIRGGLS